MINQWIKESSFLADFVFAPGSPLVVSHRSNGDPSRLRQSSRT